MNNTGFSCPLMNSARRLISQMLRAGKKFLVTLMNNFGNFGEALVWISLWIYIGVNFLIFNIQG
jgi:hypothetical protein